MLPVTMVRCGDRIFPETKSGNALPVGIVKRVIWTNDSIAFILEDDRELYYNRDESVYSASCE